MIIVSKELKKESRPYKLEFYNNYFLTASSVGKQNWPLLVYEG